MGAVANFGKPVSMTLFLQPGVLPHQVFHLPANVLVSFAPTPLHRSAQLQLDTHASREHHETSQPTQQRRKNQEPG